MEKPTLPSSPSRTIAALVVLALWVPASSRAYTTRVTASGAQVRWETPVVEMRLDPAFRVELGTRPADVAVDVVEGVWSQVPGIPSVFVSGDALLAPGYDPDGENENGIYFLPEWPFDDNRLAVTVSTYAADGTMLDADILVNGSHDFALVPEGGYTATRPDEIVPYDLTSVLAHEVGHVLGLGENEEDPAAIMYPRIGRGDTTQRTLSADDRAGVSSIYVPAAEGGDAPAAGTPSSRSGGGGCGGATVATSETSSPAAPFAIAVWGLAWALRRRNRR